MGARNLADGALPRVGSQQLLFPEQPRDLCRKLRLNRWAVVKLHEDGLISFDPQEVQALDEGQEAGIRFVAGLITGDCDPHLLGRLLESLPKPFKYRHSDIYYDWEAKRWRPMPKQDEPDVVFADWLVSLAKNGDEATLKALRLQIDDALEAVRGTSKRSHVV